MGDERELRSLEEAVELLDQWIEAHREMQSYANYWHLTYLYEKRERKRLEERAF